MDTLTTHSGKALSALVFGTMQFGGRADAWESRMMFNAARAAKINHFDTAVGYTDGAAEKLTGAFIKDEREDIFLATKVAFTGGATRTNIYEQFDLSRKQLQEDYVDLLYLHRWNEDPLEETFSTLAELQETGAIRHIGVSNFAAWQVMKAQAVAAEFGVRIDVIQPMYNLVKRQAEVELFPMARDQDIKVCPYSPLGGGLLTGKYAGGATGRLTEVPMYRDRYGQTWMHDAATAFAAMARDLGHDPATLAVSWTMANPVRPMPIISGRSLEQLQPSLLARADLVPPDLYAQIAALTPTPPLATDRLEEQ